MTYDDDDDCGAAPHPSIAQKKEINKQTVRNQKEMYSGSRRRRSRVCANTAVPRPLQFGDSHEGINSAPPFAGMGAGQGGATEGHLRVGRSRGRPVDRNRTACASMYIAMIQIGRTRLMAKHS